MTTPTSETIPTLRRPFVVSALDGRLAAGRYRLVVSEQDIPGPSFVAFKRTAAMLPAPALSASGGSKQVFHVDSVELSAACDADSAGVDRRAPPKQKVSTCDISVE